MLGFKLIHVSTREPWSRLEKDWHLHCSTRSVCTRLVFTWWDVMTWKRFMHSWWLHQMETFSASLALCSGNSLVTGEFPVQRPVMWNFDVFFDLCLNKLLSKQSRCWWFEMPSRSLWRHCNVTGGSLVESPHKGPKMCTFGDSLVISTKNLLNRLSSCQWFEMLWGSCNVTRMINIISDDCNAFLSFNQ